MRKILNNPDNFVKETVEGICLAHGDQVTLVDNDFRCLVRKQLDENKVGIVTLGGSGHLPVFLGYVGKGLLDGCAVGDVFASPSASKLTTLIKHCDTGKGVVCVYGNYGGDKLNYAMASEEAEFDDIKVAGVKVCDDIASSDDKDARRGVAGMVYAFKVAGAAASEGYELEEVVRVTNKALDNLRTMGVALSPCIVPTVGKPTFFVEDNKMEIGMGIHGEAGIEVVDILTADEVATLIYNKINSELNLKSGDRVSVMVNGLGATPLEELYIVYRKLNMIMSEIGVEMLLPHVGEYATSMEMAGLSITIMKLDEELEKLMKVDAKSPFYTNYNI